MGGDRTIRLACGREDGINWSLQTSIGPNTKNFTGSFQTDSCERTEKNRIRSNDRKWFIFNLGKEYMKDKQIHHQWLLGERCYVLSPEAHRIRDATEAENRNRIR